MGVSEVSQTHCKKLFNISEEFCTLSLSSEGTINTNYLEYFFLSREIRRSV